MLGNVATGFTIPVRRLGALRRVFNWPAVRGRQRSVIARSSWMLPILCGGNNSV